MEPKSQWSNLLPAALAAIAICYPLFGWAQPVTVTGPATGMLNDIATLNGTVNPMGDDTTAWFEWGTNFAYENSTSHQSVGSDTKIVAVNVALTGLTQGVAYHYRCVASNSLGVVRGNNRTFWSPCLTLNGPNPMTNKCHVPFDDPGATVSVRPVAIAAGRYHSLALKADGTVVGWGYNYYGQTNTPASATNVVAIAAGGHHNLALKAGGTVAGWGDNSSGQTNIPANAINVVGIAAGDYHSLALKTDGTVVGWGYNSSGQLSIPASAINVVAIAAGSQHSLALKADGTIVSWGYNGSGQTNAPASATNVVAIAAGGHHNLALKAGGTVVGWGYNTSDQTNPPASATNVVAIAAGSQHSLALKADGTVVSWGYNNHGQTNTPASATNVVAIAAGYYYSLALKADGTVVGWGYNGYGQTNIPGDVYQLNLPITVSDTLDVDSPGPYALTYSVTNALGAVAAATRTVIVLPSPLVNTLPASSLLNGTATLNGSVIPWQSDTTAWFEWGTSVAYGTTAALKSLDSGTNRLAMHLALTNLTPGVTYHYRCVASNSFGIGSGADQSFWLPILTLNGSNPMTNECHVPFVDSVTVKAFPQAIAAGDYHSLALKGDGTVIGWGNNDFGQTSIPTSATNVVAIAANEFFSLALKADGAIIVWGYNGNGGTNIPANATNVVAIAAGYWHSLALKADGTIVGWGDNSHGQTTIPASATNVVAVAAGWYHSLALKADGNVVGCGNNLYGKITIPASVTNVVAIAAGSQHSLALKADGTVVSWGYNNHGQTNTPASATNVVAIAAGYDFSLALKADGTVVGWGYSYYGQITIPASATNAVAIAAGRYHSLALKTDGTVVGWGNNIHGQTNIPAGVYQLNLPATVSGTVDVDSPGTYVLAYSVTNSLGAVTTATRTVIVLPSPLVNTLPASSLLNGTATINGSVIPWHADTSAWFEWGSAHGYGNSTAVINVGVGTNVVAMNSGLTNLAPGLIYHYRCVASNSFGVGRGADQSFWSPALAFNGPNPMTNECHMPFVDPTTVKAAPLAITAGGYHNLALKGDGTVVGWGHNSFGQTNTPATATNLIAIAAGQSHSLALKTDGTVVGWGYNRYGQTNTPASATNVIVIAAGSQHALALKADGTVVGWGDNFNGQTNIPSSVMNVVAIAAGGFHSLALKGDGTVVGWGYNYYGQTNTPAGATNVVAIAGGSQHSLALKADGTVIGWGYNSFGQANTPASATNVVAIAAGSQHNLALKTNGTVVGWGNNTNGQTSIPARATNVVAIAAGGNCSLALKADGTIIGWGDNTSGQTNIPAGVYQLNLPIVVGGTVDVDVPGTYLLNYSIINALGAVATATRTVIVADTLPPVLTLLGSNPLMHELGTPFVDPGAAATDLCAGDRTGSIFVWGTVNANGAGSYSRVYIVADTSGNLAVTDRKVVVVTRPALARPAQLGGGGFHFSFTNTPGARFRVLASTNISLPFSGWTVVGPVIESPSGVFQFTDINETNYPARFYRVE